MVSQDKDIVSDSDPFSLEWLEMVGTAIGMSPVEVLDLIQTLFTLGRTPKEMEQHLSVLAEHNGRKLFFSSDKGVS